MPKSKHRRNGKARPRGIYHRDRLLSGRIRSESADIRKAALTADAGANPPDQPATAGAA